MSRRLHARSAVAILGALAALCAAAVTLPTAGYAAGAAPGAPGDKTVFAPADKSGFGTAYSRKSPVWFTLEHGRMSEVYYPDLGTPATRELQFIVTDGRTFATREQSARSRTTLLGRDGLAFRQVVTDRRGRWRLTKTFFTDPGRATVVTRVRFESLTGKAYRLFVYYDPALSNDGDDDSGRTRSHALVASDAHAASALVSTPAFTRLSSGYLGSSDGWTDISADNRMDWTHSSASNGNVVQTAQVPLNGLGIHRQATLTLGFGRTTDAALGHAQRSRSIGGATLLHRYAAGWQRYLSSLRKPPASLRSSQERQVYRASQLVLAASEDKRNPGAFVASPTMPWVWRTSKIEHPSGAYHLVWSRDLYEIATALVAEGDRAAAQRALTFLFDRQQLPDGHFPQNSTVTGAAHWTNVQLDETADPIVLAWQLGRMGSWSWRHVQKAADYIVGFVDPGSGNKAPYTQQERWENQSGYSPATIAAEIAGLVCAAKIARANGANAKARLYLATADRWRAKVKSWTVTHTGPYSPKPYFLRLTKNGDPDSGVRYSVGDSGPTLDQRAVVDPSFLELVRLGILRPRDAAVLNTLKVVDERLGVHTPSGTFWHRYTGDGYGEQRDGKQWDFGFPDGSRTTLGRAWPIFAGERGEYQLAAGQAAGGRLAAMAASANRSLMLPEQVWDRRPPADSGGRFTPGRPTFSATPLVWTHAQFIRLAWSIVAGRPVDTPLAVRCRYLGCH